MIDLFKTPPIFGADIDRNILFDEGRIGTFWVEQRDSTAIRALWATLANFAFDIMINDGLHEASANIRFFLGII